MKDRKIEHLRSHDPVITISGTVVRFNRALRDIIGGLQYADMYESMRYNILSFTTNPNGNQRIKDGYICTITHATKRTKRYKLKLIHFSDKFVILKFKHPINMDKVKLLT